MASWDKKVWGPDTVGILPEALRGNLAPVAVDAAHQDAGEFLHARKTSQTMDGSSVACNLLRRKAERGMQPGCPPAAAIHAVLSVHNASLSRDEKSPALASTHGLSGREGIS